MEHEKPTIDLVKRREEDKLKPKKELTQEQLDFNAEQDEIGLLMDDMFKREQLLRKEKKLFNNDDSLLLYRLPLNETQMKNIYNNLVNKNVD